MKMTASSTAAPLLLLVLCMIAASAQARPMSLSGESAIVEPEIMQPGAQHYRTKVRRRYVETEVATKLAKQLAFTQRLSLLSDLFKSVNSGKFKANNFQVILRANPRRVTDQESEEFLRDNPGLKLEVSRDNQRKIYVSHHSASPPAITNYQSQLKEAIRKAKMCIELQQELLRLKSRAQVNC